MILGVGLNTKPSQELEYAAVVTTFNSESTIEASLDSILVQSHFPNEIIVVDDCSSDRTVEILESYASTYPNMIVIKNRFNSGQSYSRNIAAKISKSEILVFFDDDDVSLRNRAESHLFMHQIGYSVTYVSSRKLYKNGYTVLCENEDYSTEKLDGKLMIRKLILGKSLNTDPVIWIPASTCSVTKEAFMQVGGFDLEMRRLEDADFAIKLGNHGLAASWTSKVLVDRFATFSSDKGGGIEGQFERKLLQKYSSLVTVREFKLSNLLIDFREAYFNRNLSCFLKLTCRNLFELAFLLKKSLPLIRRLIHDRKRGGN